jgi:hypothetical protein
MELEKSLITEHNLDQLKKDLKAISDREYTQMSVLIETLAEKLKVILF